LACGARGEGRQGAHGNKEGEGRLGQACRCRCNIHIAGAGRRPPAIIRFHDNKCIAVAGWAVAVRLRLRRACWPWLRQSHATEGTRRRASSRAGHARQLVKAHVMRHSPRGC
jgi:hypothetical protein